MITLLQVRNVVPDTLPHFNWKNVFNLEDAASRLFEVAIIVAVSILAYQIIKRVIRRIVTRQIDEDDPLVRRLKEQRAQTLGGLFSNVVLVVVTIITVLMILDLLGAGRHRVSRTV